MLTSVPIEAWRSLAGRTIEPNGFYVHDWALPANALARGRGNQAALTAWSDEDPSQLIGLMPVFPLWRAYHVPLPALVSADAYGPLCTPLLDRDSAAEAVRKLIWQAGRSGARALVLRDVVLDGAAMRILSRVAEDDGLGMKVLQSHFRASLDARRGAEELLVEALGSKKLKELRRQRHRMAEHGEVGFGVAKTAGEVNSAIEIFLTLEASGWKGGRGTALLRHDGDAAFIRWAAVAMAGHGGCEIAVLSVGSEPVAAAVLVRHQDRAFYFKIGVDERFARFSPGVQLTLEITRHLCADPAIAVADSLATPDHPMIDRIWRGRFAIGDVLISTRPNDAVAGLIGAVLVLRQHLRAQARRLRRLGTLFAAASARPRLSRQGSDSARSARRP